MTETRIITKRQKKFLIKTLCALGIDFDELININNFSEVASEVDKVKEENKILADLLNKQIAINEELDNKLNILNAQYTEVIAKLNKEALDRIWGMGDFVDDEERKNA